MDRKSYKQKPHHLVIDGRTSEISRIVNSSDTDVGSSQIGANLHVYGDAQTDGNSTASSLTVTNTLSVASASYLSGSTQIAQLTTTGNNYLSGSTQIAQLTTVGDNYLSGSVYANKISGSLTKLTDGTSAFVAGNNMTITSGSNGSVTIANKLVALYLTSSMTNSTNTGQNTSLTFAVNANEVWGLEMYGTVGCNNTGGVQFGVATPAGSTVQGMVFGAGANSSVFTSTQIQAPNVLYGTLSTVTGPAPRMASVTALVVVGSSAGSVTLQYASVTNTQTSTFYSGSYLKATRVFPG